MNEALVVLAQVNVENMAGKMPAENLVVVDLEGFHYLHMDNSYGATDFGLEEQSVDDVLVQVELRNMVKIHELLGDLSTVILDSFVSLIVDDAVERFVVGLFEESRLLVQSYVADNIVGNNGLDAAEEEYKDEVVE